MVITAFTTLDTPFVSVLKMIVGLDTASQTTPHKLEHLHYVGHSGVDVVDIPDPMYIDIKCDLKV